MIELERIIEPETTEQETAGIRPTKSQQTTEQTSNWNLVYIEHQEELVNHLELALLRAREKLQAMYEEQD